MKERERERERESLWERRKTQTGETERKETSDIVAKREIKRKGLSI